MGRTYIKKRGYICARGVSVSILLVRARVLCQRLRSATDGLPTDASPERAGFFQFFSLVFRGVFGRFDVFFDVLDGLVYLREIERLFLVGNSFVFFFDGFRGDVRNAGF